MSPGVLKGLRNLYISLGASDYGALLFHIASLLAFLGALRVSKLVASSCNDRSKHALDEGDIQLSEAGVSIRIRQSNMDQLHRGTTLQLGPCIDGGLCPGIAQLFSCQRYER